MISPKTVQSSPNALAESEPIRAYSDPHIFKNDRVLRTLVNREIKYVSTSTNYFSSVQTELKPSMRREVANWMLEVCEEEQCPSQVFCLAINYMDRFLAVTNIRRNQLQLLGAVCLLVSLKVRAHKIISAQKLIEFTDFNVTLEDLLEWEFLLLLKLDWDLSAVIAPDFVEHILQRLLRLDLAWNIESTRRNAETLIYLCYSHLGLASYPPSLIAVSSILTTLRPVLERSAGPRDTPSPSSSSSCSTHSSPPAKSTTSAVNGQLDYVIEAVEKVTLVERSMVHECMRKLEQLMHASLPPSPSTSEDEASPPDKSDTATALPLGRSSSFPQLAPKTLFSEPEPDSVKYLSETEN